MIYVLVVQDEDGYVTRLNTAPHTQAGLEALQEQAARQHAPSWVQTEER